MFDQLYHRMAEIGKDIKCGHYKGRHDILRFLVEEARDALTGDDGKLGAWEAHELDYAERAINSNFLTLASNLVGKAIEVHQLSPVEYVHGFNYGSRFVRRQ
jgi:hypothetical protein